MPVPLQAGVVLPIIAGVTGVTGWVLITTLAVALEVHPTELVTVKLYEPAAKPDTVVLAPDPEIAPGLIVHVPVGKPLSITEPVATKHVGWVMVPTVGVLGVTGWVLITTLAVALEVQPTELVTVKLYEPAAKPDTVVLAPDPEIAPGLIVHVPVGKPLSITEPIATKQVGWVIVPTVGVLGVTGWVLITTLAVALDVQPTELVTVKL
jgi:hypothetical protein